MAWADAAVTVKDGKGLIAWEILKNVWRDGKKGKLSRGDHFSNCFYDLKKNSRKFGKNGRQRRENFDQSRAPAAKCPLTHAKLEARPKKEREQIWI